MGRCWSGGKNASSHWACIADWERARSSATKIDFRDTAASSQQLDKSLLVSLIDLGTQRPDRGNNIGGKAGLMYYIQRITISADLDDWTVSGMGRTCVRQGTGTRWWRRDVSPGKMFTPGVELDLSSLQFLLLDVEGSLLDF
jgi:hypothetical protein